MVRRPTTTALVAILAVSSMAHGASLHLVVRDSLSGHRLPAVIELGEGAPTATLQAGADGRADLAAKPGTVAMTARMAGYRPLASRLHLQPSHEPVATLWLDPLRMPPWLEQNHVTASIPQGSGLIHGFVHDAATGRPLAGTPVTLELRGVGDISDGTGYFRVNNPLEASGEDRLPAADTLLVSSPGFVSLAREGLLLTGGATRVLVDLEPGQGTSYEPPSHKMMRLDDPSQIGPRADRQPEETASRAKVLLPLTPPATIRLGINCSCTDCSDVEVMSLETYVARGLNDEWIASWDGDSLLSGAVAYRSCGSWYSEHPLDPAYEPPGNPDCTQDGVVDHQDCEEAAALIFVVP